MTAKNPSSVLLNGISRKDIAAQFFKILNLGSIVIYILWYITPFIRSLMSGSQYNIIIMGFIILWILSSIILNPSWILRWNLHLIVISIMLLAFLGIALLNLSGNPRSFLMIGVSFWFPLYIYHFYKISNWNYALKILGRVILGSLFITAITTLFGLFSTPNAARILSNSKTSMEQDTLLMQMNIGGFDFVYGIILFLPILIHRMLNYKKERFITILLSCLIILIVLKASFTIALILMFLAIVFGFLSKYGNMKMTFLLVIFLCLVSLVPGNYIASPIFWFSKIIENPQIHSRLVEIATFFSSNQMTTTTQLDIRFQVYRRSFETFINNPFSGVGPFYYIKGVGIGYHSQILDDLARYGIVSLVFIVTFLVTYFKYLKKTFPPNFRINLYWVFLIFALSSLLNLSFSQPTISIILFLLIPILPTLLASNDKVKISRS